MQTSKESLKAYPAIKTTFPDRPGLSRAGSKSWDILGGFMQMQVEVRKYSFKGNCTVENPYVILER